MSRERELLQRAYDELEKQDDNGWPVSRKLMAELEDELAKPEPVDGGEFEISIRRVVVGLFDAAKKLPAGKYRLLAVRIDDDQKI